MTNKVGIGIDAQLDTSAVEQKLNALGQKIAQANRSQFTPFSKTTLSDIDRVVRQFEQLRKVNGELNRRMNATGQGKSNLMDANWEQLYPDQHVRARQMRKAFEYSTGATFAPIPPAPTPGRQPGNGGGGGGAGGGRPGGPTWGAIPGQVVQAGLRAAGPAGGVAAGALGTGMSAGVGAGLMGLMGGMLALGVGKLVGSVMEKVETAENNSVALDKLKRTLGDVNVSFNALKAVVNGSGDNLKITYAEAGQLATQFVKLGNVTSEQYKSISDELGIGVGVSRAFGMDPSQGVGVMGQMRGVGVTSNTQDSRRFALLIGETIGKSGAFAKADEVMESLAAYSMSQTRNNMGRANVEGYAGMYSSMLQSSMPGMDPAGAGSMLARINSSLSGGGSKGEASQFFTGSIGASMGLNPYQTRMLREGGAFATNDGMFGEGSAYHRFKGKTGPGGNSTFLQSSLTKLRGQYGEGSDELADATANHMGIGINQAMALLSIKPNQMGELNDYAGDLTKLSGNGIGNLTKARLGTASDRQALKAQYLGRTGSDALADADRKSLEGAGSDSALKEALSKIAMSYDQERTQGSDIRDSKNALDNIKVNIADKLVPLMTEMRHGIMYMAGAKDGKSPKDIMEAVLRAENKDKVKGVDLAFGDDLKKNFGELGDVKKQKQDLFEKNRKKVMSGEMTQEEHARQMAPLMAKEKELAARDNTIREDHAKKLEETNKLLEESIQKMRKDSEALAEPASVPGGAGGGTSGGRGSGRSGEGLGAAPMDTSKIDEKLAAAEKLNGLPPGVLKSVIQQETGGNKAYLEDPSKYHYGLNSEGRRVAGHTGKVSTAFGPFGILESTAKRPGYGVSPLKDKSGDEQIRFAAEYLAARSRSAGSIEGGLAGYGEGPAYSGSVMSRMRRSGTPLPAGAGAGASASPGYRISADDITVRVVDENGTPRAPAQQVQTRVSPAKPFGQSGVTGQW